MRDSDGGPDSVAEREAFLAAPREAYVSLRQLEPVSFAEELDSAREWDVTLLDGLPDE